jgi:hypothetical protein
LLQLGRLPNPMVAEEASRVFGPSRERVGVKRSREPSNRLAATAAEVRPALDADPGTPLTRPTMSTEGTGATSTSTESECSPRLPARPRSLLIAALLTPAAGQNDPADPFITRAGFTHGLLARETPPTVELHDGGRRTCC